MELTIKQKAAILDELMANEEWSINIGMYWFSKDYEGEEIMIGDAPPDDWFEGKPTLYEAMDIVKDTEPKVKAILDMKE